MTNRRSLCLDSFTNSMSLNKKKRQKRKKENVKITFDQTKRQKKREEVVSVGDFGSHRPKKQLKKETIILCNSMETAAHIYSLLLCVLRSWRRHRTSVRREEITFQAINKFFLTFPLSTPFILRLSSFWLLSYWDFSLSFARSTRMLAFLLFGPIVFVGFFCCTSLERKIPIASAHQHLHRFPAKKNRASCVYISS